MAQRISSTHIERVIADIARDQLGLVTQSDAGRHGLHSDAIAHRVRNGLLCKVFAGVYRTRSSTETNLQRALAASLTCRGIVVGRWAAHLHGFPFPADDLTYFEVDLMVPGAQRVAQRGISAVRADNPFPSQPWLSGRTLTADGTLMHLASTLSSLQLGRCIDHCIARRLTTVDACMMAISDHPAQRMAGRTRLMAELSLRVTGVKFRSNIEGRVERWLVAARLPEFSSNFAVAVGGGRRVEVDFAWRSQRVALEVSPFYTHGARHSQERDAERRRLLLLAGWRILEADDTHLSHIAAFAPIVRSLRALLCTAPGFTSPLFSV
jgi:very-short-patch-repair endonuclease